MDFPVIRLELQQMKQAMLVALAQYNSEIETIVAEKLEQAIREFDYEGQVRRIADDVLQLVIKQSIESYFRYGAGRDAINAVIEEMFNKVLQK